jgi:hypothetical protein
MRYKVPAVLRPTRQEAVLFGLFYFLLQSI